MFPLPQSKKPKEPMPRFSIKAKEARDDRESRIKALTKDILGYLEKNKIDDRDAKPALKAALAMVNNRNSLEK
jgi:hypothetical protein